MQYLDQPVPDRVGTGLPMVLPITGLVLPPAMTPRFTQADRQQWRARNLRDEHALGMVRWCSIKDIIDASLRRTVSSQKNSTMDGSASRRCANATLGSPMSASSWHERYFLTKGLRGMTGKRLEHTARSEYDWGPGLLYGRCGRGNDSEGL